MPSCDPTGWRQHGQGGRSYQRMRCCDAPAILRHDAGEDSRIEGGLRIVAKIQDTEGIDHIDATGRRDDGEGVRGRRVQHAGEPCLQRSGNHRR
jgi:hypothetical protein